MLQAIPFWIASVITGLIAVVYARLFLMAEDLTTLIFTNSMHGILFILIACLFCCCMVAGETFCALCKGKWYTAGSWRPSKLPAQNRQQGK